MTKLSNSGSDFEEEREVIEIYMNDWLVIKHNTTRMDLIDACEMHKEAIFSDKEIE